MSHQPRMSFKPERRDPKGITVRLYDQNRKNREGKPYCVNPRVLAWEIDATWQEYVDSLRRR
jgi:hypothetical protein